jgi:hypothetical protein
VGCGGGDTYVTPKNDGIYLFSHYKGLHGGDAKKEINQLVTNCMVGGKRPVSSCSNGQAGRSEKKIP